jgi:hypothetical protein
MAATGHRICAGRVGSGLQEFNAVILTITTSGQELDVSGVISIATAEGILVPTRPHIELKTARLQDLSGTPRMVRRTESAH